MTRLAPLSLVAALSTMIPASADAGKCGRVRIHPPVPTIQPIGWPQPPIAQPPSARPWYFGLSVQITHTPYGRGLQIVSVTPGAPAQMAGLEVGDTLLASSMLSFNQAYSNQHGVDLLQRSVLGSGAPAPTTTGVSTFIAPPVVNPSGYVDLQVLDIRTGGVANLRVFPQRIGGGYPAPAISAPATTTVSFR